MRDVLGIVKGKDKLESIEGYLIYILLLGALIMSAGIGLTVVSTRGISAILAMLGALISFLSTVALIVVWFVQEFKGE